MNGPAVYPVFYHGPVNLYARLIREEEIIFEQYDHYTKQTYRNRCRIVGPNGVLTLSVPVKRKKGAPTCMKDIRLDYDTPWPRVHWRTLEASYASSPYFEFIRDELAPFYEARFDFLLDLNIRLTEWTLGWLGLFPDLKLSSGFTDITDNDPREIIHPKKREHIHDPAFTPVPYTQVFSDRLGFQANMSILDLLFNEGGSAPSVLKKSLRTGV